MPTPPPAWIAQATQKVRHALSSLRRKLVPPAVSLTDLVEDFWGFHIAFALAELQVVDALKSGPRSASEVASELELDADHLYRLLRASSMLGFVRELPARTFSLRARGLALCESDDPTFRDFLLFMGRHGTKLWPQLPTCVRRGQPVALLEGFDDPFTWLASMPETQRDFTRAMSGVSTAMVDPLLAAYDVSARRCIIDIGGGHGRLLTALLEAAPSARGVLFDLPDVIQNAGAMLADHGVADRVTSVGGSFFESVPEGGDLYVMKTIIHDWDDDKATSILKNIRRELRPDARLILYEMVVPAANVPGMGKLLDIEMIVTAGGRERTEREYATLLQRADLRLTRVIPTAGPMSIVEAAPRP
jgi:SAM-dependent methyltransferase